MPELPEVNTVIKILKEEVLNKCIDKVVIFHRNSILNDENYFIDNLKDKTILDIKRLGKYIIFILSDDKVLISHLRMEGKYFILLMIVVNLISTTSLNLSSKIKAV